MPIKTPSLLLVPDEPGEWAKVLKGKDQAEKMARALPTVAKPRARLAHADHPLIHRLETIATGACEVCVGTNFWEAPEGSGNWICSRCHPPVGTVQTITVAYKTTAGPWEAETVTIGG